MRPIDMVRRRPGMYVGDTNDGSGVFQMLMEVIANSMDQHLAGRCDRVDVVVEEDETITVRDNGPGIPAPGTATLPPLEVLLTQFSRRPTVDGHAPHVHLELIGVGLQVVNFLSEAFTVTTVHEEREATIGFARGELSMPLTVTPTTKPSGTTVRFRPDPEVFTLVRVPRVLMASRFEDLALTRPGLRISWAIHGDSTATRGWPGRVADLAGRRLDEIAVHRGRFEVANGPVDVEVAVAWVDEATSRDPVIHSFVNLGRTRGDGTHADGMVTAIRRFMGATRRTKLDGLVAAVAVVLSDVHWGNPTKDRLETPAAGAAVEQATTLALTAWAEANPEHAAARRDRLRSRS